MREFEGKADFDVHWLPFQLAPQAEGGQGINKLEMYRAKFGAARVEHMLPMMLATGRKEGIEFSYGGNTGNTFDSHRLISLAAKQGKQDEIVEELFRNYFEEEKCISDQAVLVAAADKVGVVGVPEMMSGKGEVEEVNADLRKYQGGMRINGVPHFIINDKYHESGALEASSLVQIFDDCLK